MNKQAAKRKKRIQLTFIYSLMIISVVGITAILIMAVQGYRFNRYDGQIEQGGLVQFNTQPTGATIQVDSIVLSSRTPHRVTLSSGDHAIKMSRDGYRDWQKNVTVAPGTVLWLDYAKLIPNDISSSTVMNFDKIDDSLASPGQKSMAILPDRTKPDLTVVSLDSDDNPARSFSLKASDYTQSENKNSSFDIEAWDRDGRYLVIKHSYDSSIERIAIDTREPYNAINLGSMFPEQNISKIEFALYNNRRLYVLNASNEVREINLEARTVSSPLLRNIAGFAQYDQNTITYETLADESKNRSVGYLTRGSDQPLVVRNYADDGSSLGFRLGMYYGKIYYLVAHGSKLDIMTGDLPGSATSANLTLTNIASLALPEETVETLGFSPKDGRFAYLKSQKSLVVYDLELNKSSQQTFAKSTPENIHWADGFHYTYQLDNTLKISEFDGQNTYDIGAGSTGAIAMREDGKYIYNIVASDSGSRLVKYLLIP